ncbi:hypothetical protein OIN82_18180 [Acinetobacter baumannii]|nr:hypothetical protein [Acinetobacter baumannii]MDC5633018.1 hypothetical protein [Acinetobacter baumannii]
MLDLNKLRSEFEAQHSDKVFKIVKFDEATNAYCLHAHLPLTEINLSALAEINYGWDLWQKAKAQAVPDTQQKLTNTYYWEGSDYVVDCPFEYDIEIDKGEVLELQKWQRTESTKVYFANIYKDEDNFEILQFASKAEAENAVAENLKFLEASESGAEK